MDLPTETDVMIVGAGPTGLSLAAFLASNGVGFVLIDKSTEAAGTSRAAAVHARTLQALESIGVSDEMVAAGRQIPRVAVQEGDRTLLRINFADLPTRYRFILGLPQNQTEAILAGRLEALGGTIARGWEATGVRQEPDASIVEMRDAAGTVRTIRSRFVVGADGYHSAVRAAAGIGFSAGTYPQSFVLADVRMDWPLPADEMRVFLAADGTAFVAPLPNGRFRIIAGVDQPPQQPTLADVQAIMDTRGPRLSPVGVREVVWASRFRIHHGVAASYRAGRIFLAGDAAHVHSPAGGQGMNIGIQDAIALGERLAAVINRGEPDSGLAGYEAARRPVAQRVVAMTDRMTRVATIRSPAGQFVRSMAIRGAGYLPGFGTKIAAQMAELAD